MSNSRRFSGVEDTWKYTVHRQASQRTHQHYMETTHRCTFTVFVLLRIPWHWQRKYTTAKNYHNIITIMCSYYLLKSAQKKNIFIHTHPFNGSFSGNTRVGRYQKGKTSLDFTEASESEWKWHQLGRMQACTSLQTDNHASTPPLQFYRPDALPVAQSTASKH